MEGESLLSNEQREKIHKLVVLVGDQGYQFFDRDFKRFSGFLQEQLNISANPNSNGGNRALILKKITQR